MNESFLSQVEVDKELTCNFKKKPFSCNEYAEEFFPC